MTDDKTEIDTDKAKAKITEKALDHVVDGLCAAGIVAVAMVGMADTTTVGGLVTIALGKRVMAAK